MWNPPVQARRMVNGTWIRKSKTWQASRGIPTPFPILKISRQLKKFFLIKKKEDKGKEEETREDRSTEWQAAISSIFRWKVVVLNRF